MSSSMAGNQSASHEKKRNMRFLGCIRRHSKCKTSTANIWHLVATPSFFCYSSSKKCHQLLLVASTNPFHLVHAFILLLLLLKYVWLCHWTNTAGIVRYFQVMGRSEDFVFIKRLKTKKVIKISLCVQDTNTKLIYGLFRLNH